MMNKPVIFMFSGQGSQYYQMGKELYENNAQFRYWMDHCNEIVSPLIQTSLVDVLYGKEGKSKPFDRLLYSNPALLCIEYCQVKVLKELGIQPDFLLGYSLGELTASVISGSVSLEDGIQLVVDIAKLAEQRTQSAAMLAIMESKAIMAKSPDLFEQCWCTGTNFQENFVVCGLPHVIQNLQGCLNNINIISQVLPVKYGFHTELIDPIEEEFKQVVKKIKFSSASVPIISASRNEVIKELKEDYLWEVIRFPVNFEQTVDKILEKGDYVFIDSGPSGTLATFVKYMLPSNSGSVSFQMINQFGRDLNAIEKLKTSLLENVI
ncbi:MAG: acyltransferase domain-containing protein [Sporocytophaga sp.]|uniref:acyltransferase domain-containing protein n=1 Tax=Sporocytophaga sp. TaxID=2231183 RepID=UPI001B0ABFBA|nr:acyltransferase domain-containing protein [Sporocytophaga sp.]MBO9699898.1 acyltransferase domain-containing protein [Sporocytophaga sp.]